MKRSHPMVNKVLSEEEDIERFYREVDKNKWYRAAMLKIVDLERERAANEAEAAALEGDEAKALAALHERRALERVKHILRIGDRDVK